ncbi:hypothetical protein K2173_017463 [Erythroxylum novogranatense]|uniref:Rab-GAP TBC domain-containing protein n=1 Tax=Erythroxylum novogranatense TaxID=1862640 RepID=A0AAV8TMV9_9ROSI|nr:hypothetical protein K2173_017463 [Erythroxylum novogranatense]
MSPAAIEKASPELGCSKPSDQNQLGFPNLRGVRWRINLRILPSSSSVDDLRRVTADCRRRYAALRRRLLVDPQIKKDESNSPDLVLDNPLSQNPDSTWSRFFRNAELEKTVDQDLSRLYPEHESYFQTPGCQGMLRRILLLWCLRHPEYSYKQGMHELLAPLLYVLHVDIEHLTEVRKQYEDHFTDKFDDLSVHENDLTYNFEFKKLLDPEEDEIGSKGNATKVKSLLELDPEIQTILMLSDAYGAEGELGIVLSEKFMEHDAYSMFDALMSGAHGSVAMADFFSPSPAVGSHSGLPPVIEASSALYHLLSIVDSSLHSHLVELGVEPQYFSLRWLRVLFGREFSLLKLLFVWDEIFAADNNTLDKVSADDTGSSFATFNSPRGALISAIAVSMLLHLRSSLLATENATTCLKRLLNFPENVDLKKLINKAKSVQTLALETNVLSSSPLFGGETYIRNKPRVTRGHTLSVDSIPTIAPLYVVPDSYWEEKWRHLHKAEELRKENSEKRTLNRKKGWSEKVRLSLSRTESEPSPANVGSSNKVHKSSVRRRLLEDLCNELGLDEDTEKASCLEVSNKKDDQPVGYEGEGQDSISKDLTCTDNERRLSGNYASEENSSVFSDPSSPSCGSNDHEIDSEKSSVASNLYINENDGHPEAVQEDSVLPVSHDPYDASFNSESSREPTKGSSTGAKDRKLLSGKFQWFWKFGHNNVVDETSKKGNRTPDSTISASDACKKTANDDSSVDGPCLSTSSEKGDGVDQNVMGILRNLGQSMLEHIQVKPSSLSDRHLKVLKCRKIFQLEDEAGLCCLFWQVIESVFQQDRGQAGSLENFSKNILVGKGQVTAMTAIKELRKISNLLLEM